MSVLLIPVAIVGLVVLALLAGLVAALIVVTRRSRRVQEVHSARITKEIEKIDAMQAAGRISAAESAELRQALDDRGPGVENTVSRGRLCKSSSTVLAGVCGGLAEWMNWDPTLVRVGYVLATLLIACFPGVITYLILAVVMPSAADAPPVRTGRGLLLVLLLLVLLLPVLLAAAMVCLRFSLAA